MMNFRSALVACGLGDTLSASPALAAGSARKAGGSLTAAALLWMLLGAHGAQAEVPRDECKDILLPPTESTSTQYSPPNFVITTVTTESCRVRKREDRHLEWPVCTWLGTICETSSVSYFTDSGRDAGATITDTQGCTRQFDPCGQEIASWGRGQCANRRSDRTCVQSPTTPDSSEVANTSVAQQVDLTWNPADN